jgi:Flp pilus assembly protein TadD
MISTRFVKLAVSGLALGMSLTGGHPVTDAPSAAAPEAKQLQIAAEAATKANAALAAQNYRGAVRFAETAVEYAPRNAAYRLMLGQAYLGAGRFASAETSFADTLTLTPDNGRAALNLALTEIAQGKRDQALSTLSDYREKLAVSDYGLAVGLAGDVETAITTLEAAIRGGDTDAKTRQNLALSYALAGRWSNARVMAMQDLSGNDVNDRIAQWASFVRPGSTYDQVASLLGVKPVEDGGQPTRLALNGFVETAVAGVEPSQETVVETSAPVQTAMADPAPAPVAFETPVSAAPPASAGVIMGERREIVQPLPASYASYAKSAPTIRAAAGPVKQVIVAKPKPKPAITAARSKTHRYPVTLGSACRRALAWRTMIRPMQRPRSMAQTSCACRSVASPAAPKPMACAHAFSAPGAHASFVGCSVMRLHNGCSVACPKLPSPSALHRAN